MTTIITTPIFVSINFAQEYGIEKLDNKKIINKIAKMSCPIFFLLNKEFKSSIYDNNIFYLKLFKFCIY